MSHYEIRYGSYYLIDDNTGEINGMMDEVAIAFDPDSGTLYKHGNPSWVIPWHKEWEPKHASVGLRLELLIGKFDIEELNKCLDNSTYVGIFAKKLKSQIDPTAAPQLVE